MVMLDTGIGTFRSMRSTISRSLRFASARLLAYLMILRNWPSVIGA